MIWRFLRQCVSDELAHGQGISQPPGNSPFRINPFEVPQEQRTKVDPRRDAGPSPATFVIPPAQLLHVTVEVVLVENLIQPVVKGMRRCTHNLAGDHPKVFLSLAFLAGSHGHAV